MTSSPSFAIDPLFRIQVQFENEPGAPTKEFPVNDLSDLTFEALLAHIFEMSCPNESKDDYNITFKYQIEERHDTRWVVFENTVGFGYAVKSNPDKDYAFISACIVKKGAAIPVVSPSTAARRATKTPAAKSKVAKKAKPTKPKASRGSGGSKLPVEQLVLSSLKELLDVGITSPPKTQIAMFTGYSNVQSLSFKTALKNLLAAGLIEYPDKETISLTETGAAKAPTVGTPAITNEQVQERLKRMLKDKAPLIFDELKDGGSHIRVDVAASVGYSNPQSKGFKDAVKQMIALKMLELPDGDKKFLRLTDIAFPFGRPAGASAGEPMADVVKS